MVQYSSLSPPDSGRIRCVCEYDEDDGFTIQCEQCLVWQHAKCVGISKNSVPEQYFCEECNPGWHEDLHNLALRAINLDVINNTTNTTTTHPTTTTNINILEDSASTPIPPRTGFKRKILMPAGVPSLNEITENIISNDAQPVIEAFLKSINVPRLKRQQHAQDPNLINFEFQATVVMDSAEHLALLQKNLEVREIRNRGYQKKGTSTKYGLFATEPCDPGHFVCEFIGHVQLKNLLTVKGAKEVPVTVTQSFVLYPLASIDLAIDARKFGSGVRYARRSCRPNVQIKPVIVFDSSGDYVLSWGLFARNIIKANSEILLPLDYQCGNGLFKYECACNAPDFCLGPLDNFTVTLSGKEVSTGSALGTSQRPSSPKPSTAAAASGFVVESAELEALGIRRSSSAILQDSQNAATATTRPILDTRKLTREERKLQKYIEYFEKMDSADAAKKVSSTSNSSLGSRKGSSSGSSPQQSSRISSPEKASAGGLKKAWKQLFSSSGDQVDGGESDSLQIVNEEQLPVKTGAKRGRKPSAKPADLSPKAAAQTETVLSPPPPAAPSSPLKPKNAAKSPGKRKKSVTSSVSIVDEESLEEIDVGSEVAPVKGVENKKVKLDKSKKKDRERAKESDDLDAVKEGVQVAPQVTSSSPLIDIERCSSVLSGDVNMTDVQAAENPATAPDTPSKKKLSLSDYLKKKKASPVGPVPLNFDESEPQEEGELPPEKPEQLSFLSESVLNSRTRGLEDGEVEAETSETIANISSSREFLRQSISGTISSVPSFEELPNGIKSGPSSSGWDTRNDRDYREARDSRDQHPRSNSRDYPSSRDYARDYPPHREYPVNPPATFSSSSTTTTSRFRDEREKEFDRLQREREFERREAERERERREREMMQQQNRFKGGEYQRDYRHDNRPDGRFDSRPDGRYDSRHPSYRPFSARPHYNPHGHHSRPPPSNYNRPSDAQNDQQPQQHQYPRPPHYRPNYNKHKDHKY